MSLSCAKEEPDTTAQIEAKPEVMDPNGTLYFRLSNEPTFLNPLLYTDVYSGQIVGMVFNGLFRINESLDLEPDLVDTYEVSEDGKTYTFKLIDTPVEFVTYRLAATASVPRPEVKKLSNVSRSIEDAHAGKRMVNFLEDGRHEAAIYLRDRLPSGCELDGPIIIEEATSTTIVHPGQSMIVDDFGFLRISEGKSV